MIELKKNYISEIYDFLLKQVNNILPDGYEFINLYAAIEITLEEKVHFNNIKIWKDNSDLDVMNSLKYPIFLYKLSHLLFTLNDIKGATKIFYLNKILHGIDVFYEIKLGENIIFSHTIGSVFSKALYGDYSVFYQGILIGVNNSNRPILNNGLIIFPGSQIIGKCNIGENVVISANTTIIDIDIPNNVYVFPGKGRKPILKDLNEYYADRYFIRDPNNEK